MRFLALDTSFKTLSVCAGFFEEGRFASRLAAGPGDGSHNEGIAALTTEALGIFDEAARPDIVFIGSGPGSFTGLRIGYSFAAGLRLALNTPVVQVSTFAAAAACGQGDGEVLVCADAGREEVFCALYRKDGGTLVVLWEPCIKSVSGALSEAGAGSSKRLTIVAPEGKVGPYRAQVPEALAENIAKLGSKLWLGKIPGPDHPMPEPLYLRAVNAKTIEERAMGSSLKNVGK